MLDPLPFTLAVRHSRLNRVRLGIRWAAWFLMLNAGASLAARLLGPARVPGLTLGLVPMNPVLAIAQIGNGLALWAFIGRRRGLHLISAVVSLLLGIFVFVFVARSPGSTALPTSVAGALLGVFASFALVIAWIRGRSGLVNLTFGVAGFVLLSLSITVIGVRVIGAFGPDTARIFVGASWPGLINSIVLSLSFLSLVWAEGFSTTKPPGWVAPAAGIACLLAVLLLWRALDARETETLQSQMLLVARVQRQAIYRDARALSGALRRAADWAARGVPAEQQAGDLAALVRDVPGLLAGLRVSATGDILLRMPRDFDASRVTEAWRRRVSRYGLFDSLSYLPLDARAERFAVVSPICSAGVCNGAVVGVVDAPVLFASTLPSAEGGFLLITHQNGRVLGTDSLRLPPSDWREDLDLHLGVVRWQLSVMPTDATLRQMRTTLPTAVLFMGLIVSALLPVTLRLGQVAWRTAHASERARLSSALERATDAIWEWDLVTGHDERTRGLWRHLGYDPSTVAPGDSAWASLVHPDDRADVDAALARHISGAAATFEAEYRVRDSSGNWHVIVDRGRLVERTADGSPARLVGICADVTEARRMQEARDTSERRFRAIFDSGFQCKLLLDADGRVLEVNRASLDLAGVLPDAVLDRPVWETLWWRSSAESATRLREQVAMASGGETVRYEEETSAVGGSTLILEVGLKRVNPGAGRASQLLLEARDVTARRRVDAALQELETLAAMGRIAARVAHEINNPLAGIQYSFLLIKDAIPTDHPHYRYVGAIEREISRIAAVTRQLYETYRPEKETSASASLSTIIGDAVSFLEQVNRASAVRIQTDLSQAPSIVPVPSAVLRQIVYNLVQNAMDASPPNETVLISAVATRDTLEIRVSDNGPGLAPEMRQRVFEPFFSTKDMRMRTSGMGLGLALVQQTVKSAGGSIRVEQSPAGGALFIVTLPLMSGQKTEVA
ncbi:MAG TPA: ATP-binding protein [Gemmatimonadaceae bacterium]|nr:ATP-binding protein [Gemmatimonadaceae bacterium]